MNIGDRVKVTNPKLKSHGEKGRVDRVENYGGGHYHCVVNLDNGATIGIGEKNLEKLTNTVQPSNGKIDVSKKKHFAHIYGHDADEGNPTFNELIEELDRWDITEVSDAIYGTKEEIRKAVNRVFDDYEHVFCLIDGVYVPTTVMLVMGEEFDNV